MRPEAVRVADARDAAAGGTLEGMVDAVLYQGERSECGVRLGNGSILVYASSDRAISPGDRIALALAADAARLWPK